MEKFEYPKIAIALVHYPIHDRMKSVVATNITNLDIHDISRAASVYGVEKYFILHPMQEQLMFVERVLDHWRTGRGAKFNPFRRTALNPIQTVSNLDEIKRIWQPDLIVATHARAVYGTSSITFNDLRQVIHKKEKSVLIIFGTGFGLTDEFMQACDAVLEPIKGAPPKDYRHLSVRSAVSICLDRLMGSW